MSIEDESEFLEPWAESAADGGMLIAAPLLFDAERFAHHRIGLEHRVLSEGHCDVNEIHRFGPKAMHMSFVKRGLTPAISAKRS